MAGILIPQGASYGLPTSPAVAAPLITKEAMFGIPSPTRALGPLYHTYLRSLNPQAWWKLNDPVGSSTAADTMGLWPGTVHGSVVFGKPGPFAGASSALFDGSTGYITSSFLNATADILGTATILGWIYVPGSIHGACFGVGNGNNGYLLGMGNGTNTETNGLILMGTYNDVAYLSSGVTLPIGWNFVALNVLPSAQFYANGSTAGANQGHSAITPSVGTTIGYDSGGAPRYWGSYISDVAMFAPALTAAQIAKLRALA